MSFSIKNDKFVQTITNLDLDKQHLSTNLTAVDKPNFFLRFITSIFGGNTEEKITVARKISRFITDNEYALQSWKQASPAEFEAFRNKLDTLSGKLQRNMQLPNNFDFATKIGNIQASPTAPKRPAPVSTPVAKADPAAVVPNVVSVQNNEKAARIITPEQQVKNLIGESTYGKLLGEFGPKVMAKVVAHYIRKPKSSISEQMIRQYITNSAMSIFKSQEAYSKFITTYGSDTADLLVKHFSRELLETKSINADQMANFLIRLAESKVGQPLKQELVDTYGQKIAGLIIVNYLSTILLGGEISVKSTAQFASECFLNAFGRETYNHLVLSCGREIARHVVVSFTDHIRNGNAVTEAMATDRVATLLERFFGKAGVDIKLFANYGNAVLNHVVKRFHQEILGNKKVAAVDVYAVANTYLLDELMAKNLRPGETLEETFRRVILGGKSLPGTTMKAFRLGEFIFTNGAALQNYTGA